MSLSNPAKFFVSGNKEKAFTYEGGSHLWHFSPYDCGLSTSMEMNLIFFANDGQHALDVIVRLCEFAIACSTERGNHMGVYNQEMEDRRVGKISYMQNLLTNRDKWIVTLAPMDQVYKVGWAANDTL